MSCHPCQLDFQDWRSFTHHAIWEHGANTYELTRVAVAYPWSPLVLMVKDERRPYVIVQEPLWPLGIAQTR